MLSLLLAEEELLQHLQLDGKLPVKSLHLALHLSVLQADGTMKELPLNQSLLENDHLPLYSH